MWNSKVPPPPEALAYATTHGLEIVGGLGAGNDGTLWQVRRKGEQIRWAMKIHTDAGRYQRERDCYLRLTENCIERIGLFWVPTLIRYEDRSKVIEMSIVVRPFLLDFAQAYLDIAPEFPEGVWVERLATWSEYYGMEWPEVRRALSVLEGLGIHYLDVHHGNIAP